MEENNLKEKEAETAADVPLTKKERRKLFKEQRKLERGSLEHKKKIRTILFYSVFAIILIGLVYILYTTTKYIKPGIDDDPFIGDANAQLTIIEFGDFQCPFTKEFNDGILPKLLEEYKGKIKIVYRDIVTNKHVNSDISAEAAQCANEQGKFEEYHNILFQRQGTAAKDNLKSYAQKINLDMDKFNSCFDSEKYKNEVKKDTKDGKKAKVSVTPTIFINDLKMNGIFSLEEYKKAIEEELKKKKKKNGKTTS